MAILRIGLAIFGMVAFLMLWERALLVAVFVLELTVIVIGAMSLTSRIQLLSTALEEQGSRLDHAQQEVAALRHEVQVARMGRVPSADHRQPTVDLTDLTGRRSEWEETTWPGTRQQAEAWRARSPSSW